MKNINLIIMHYLRKSLIFCFFILLVEFSSGRDTLSTGQILKDGDSLTSAKGSFTLGFFSPGRSQNRYLAIYFSDLRGKKVVWVANRDNPLNYISGVLSFHTPNNLVLHGSDPKVPIWSTSFLGPGKNYSAQLLDTGNLVVFDEDMKGIISWQSFDHPTNTWLPDMKLGVNRKTGLNWSLTSWTSKDDPGTGRSSVRMDVLRELSELSLYEGSNKVWRSGPLTGSRLDMLSVYIFNVTYVDNEDVVYMTYSIREPSTFSIIMVTDNGFIWIEERNPHTLKWRVVWGFPTGECEEYNYCGPNKYCATSKIETKTVGQCYCFPGFESKVFSKSAGCVRKRDRNVCRNGEGFLKFSYYIGAGIREKEGTLKDGYVIAVKRLSETSQQGVVEFKNEATLVSRLRHVNLVRLLGCCAEQKEKILIYEYMPNKSLDSLIFDPEKSSRLNWEQRFNIIMGITRGMMYLHADSRGTIVHRDLKASNILLDAQMNPKVSDFGMARFFDNNEVEAITRTVVGTYGYMAPEYIKAGTYSTKSDVYSFGVLLLEIISARKNNTYINKEMMNLISLAWSLRERALEIV